MVDSQRKRLSTLKGWLPVGFNSDISDSDRADSLNIYSGFFADPSAGGGSVPASGMGLSVSIGISI